MANVKITELTELAAADLADGDVFPIVDVGADTTKKVTAASIRQTLAYANDYATYTFIDANLNIVSSNADAYYTQLNANINVVQDNVATNVTDITALETRRSDNVFFSLNLTGAAHANVIINDANVEPTSNNTYSLGAPDKVWKELYLGPNSLKIGNITISDLGGEGITITGASGEQANVVTPQLGGAANVSANIATLEANVASTDVRLGANVALLTAEDTALQARIAANTLVAASNDFVTYTRLQANIDLVQDNVATVSVGTAADTETRLNANLDIVQDNVSAISVTLGIRGDGDTNDDVTVGTEELVFLGDTGITTTVSSNSVSIDLDDTAVSAGLYGGVEGTTTNVAVITVDAQGRITAASNATVAVDLATLESNVDIVQDNVAAAEANVVALEARRAANVTLRDAEDTALQARLTTNVTIFTDEDTALQSRLATNVTAFTNEDTALQARLTTNVTAFTNEDTALQTRIAANTLVAASNDFVTYTQLNANINVVQDNVAAIIDGTTNFTGEVTMSDDLIVTGNLTVNGDTVTINTTNMDVDDTMIMLANGTTGSPANDIGILFNRGSEGNAAFFYDESATTFKLSDTLDPKSNTSLSPVTAANLNVGILDAATVKFDGTSVQDAISANVTTLTNEDTALQARLTTNVTTFTNEDTALQARLTTNVTAFTNEDTAIEARRVANIAGAVSTITTGNLTASRALESDGSGKVAVSAITSTELGYLDGVTSAIQTQLDAKLASTSYTASDVLTKLLTVDGTGSSLDADQLDGQHGNYYAVETTRASNAAELASGIASAVAGSGITGFSFEDDDSTSVEMGDSSRVKFVEGGGVDINFTDVSPGSVADPFDLTFTVTSSVVAGAGLTGGGQLNADRTLNIGAGTGVTVNADDIAIGQDVATSASPTFAGLTVTTFDLGALS
jgi:hypothetical protein